MRNAKAPNGAVDITTSEFALNPVRGYNQLRAASPVSWQQPFKAILFTDFADVAQALRSPLLVETNPFSGWHSIAKKLGRDYRATLTLFDYMPFIYEGAKHRRLRATLARGLVPFSDAHETFHWRVGRTLAALARTQEFDLAKDFSASLFFEILCDLMGISKQARPAIRPLSRLSFALDATLPVRIRDKIEGTIASSMNVLTQQVDELLSSARPTLLHSMRDALPADESDPVSAIAHLATTMFLMGSDAVSGSITIAVRHLLGTQSHDPHGEQKNWARLSDDTIRFVAPVDYLTRVATTDVSIGHFKLHAGDRIIASPLAANHDSKAFGSDAGTIRVRPRNDVGMAFGAGSHVCVGARIARNIVRSAFDGLAELPPIALAGEAEQNPGRVVRSLASLPVRFV